METVMLNSDLTEAVFDLIFSEINSESRFLKNSSISLLKEFCDQVKKLGPQRKLHWMVNFSNKAWQTTISLLNNIDNEEVESLIKTCVLQNLFGEDNLIELMKMCLETIFSDLENSTDVSLSLASIKLFDVIKESLRSEQMNQDFVKQLKPLISHFYENAEAKHPKHVKLLIPNLISISSIMLKSSTKADSWMLASFSNIFTLYESEHEISDSMFEIMHNF